MIAQEIVTKYQLSSGNNPKNPNSIYWALIIMKKDYQFDENFESEFAEYFEFSLPGDCLCILAEYIR